mgnify:CR=1 FL=1
MMYAYCECSSRGGCALFASSAFLGGEHQQSAFHGLLGGGEHE